MSGWNVFPFVTEITKWRSTGCYITESDRVLLKISYRYGDDWRDPVTQLLFIVALVPTIDWIIIYFYYVHVSLSAPACVKLAPISTLLLTWVRQCDFIVTHSVADEVISSHVVVIVLFVSQTFSSWLKLSWLDNSAGLWYYKAVSIYWP